MRFLGYYSYVCVCIGTLVGCNLLIKHLVLGISVDFGEGFLSGIMILLFFIWLGERGKA